jgi:diguanylate cyclase (GGDEF)-like protein
MTAPSFSMPALLLTTLAQADMVNGVIGVLVSVAVSFVIIVLVASYYRFQHIVEQAEEKSPEEMGTSAMEILRVQLARYFAASARKSSSFSLAFIDPGTRGSGDPFDAPLIQAVKHAARRDDQVCMYEDGVVALLAESEPEDAENMLSRIVQSAARECEGVELETMRAGIASCPGHGLNGPDLIETALAGLKEASSERPVVLPEITEDEEEEEEHEGEELEKAEDTVPDEAEDAADEDAEGAEEEEADAGRGWRSRRKESILDPATGVLKPSVVPVYMKRMLSDLRYKKKQAALFCIGVNNMDHITRFHGEEAADAIMSGVSAILQDNLRADDLIGRHEKHAFIVLAKCSLEEAEGIGKRISTLVQQSQFTSGQKKLRTTITLGVSTYPEHGRNLHHLYAASQKVLDYSRTNDIRAYAVYDPDIHDKMPSRPMKSIKSIEA